MVMERCPCNLKFKFSETAQGTEASAWITDLASIGMTNFQRRQTAWNSQGRQAFRNGDFGSTTSPSSSFRVVLLRPCRRDGAAGSGGAGAAPGLLLAHRFWGSLARPSLFIWRILAFEKVDSCIAPLDLPSGAAIVLLQKMHKMQANMQNMHNMKNMQNQIEYFFTKMIKSIGLWENNSPWCMMSWIRFLPRAYSVDLVGGFMFHNFHSITGSKIWL